eukprot:6198060-Pleurochrysis_carterae.AAC.5
MQTCPTQHALVLSRMTLKQLVGIRSGDACGSGCTACGAQLTLYNLVELRAEASPKATAENFNGMKEAALLCGWLDKLGLHVPAALCCLTHKHIL